MNVPCYKCGFSVMVFFGVWPSSIIVAEPLVVQWNRTVGKVLCTGIYLIFRKCSLYAHKISKGFFIQAFVTVCGNMFSNILYNIWIFWGCWAIANIVEPFYMYIWLRNLCYWEKGEQQKKKRIICKPGNILMDAATYFDWVCILNGILCT